MRSSPHPKPPTGYPREAVGDLMGLKGKWQGAPSGNFRKHSGIHKEMAGGTLWKLLKI